MRYKRYRAASVSESVCSIGLPVQSTTPVASRPSAVRSPQGAAPSLFAIVALGIGVSLTPAIAESIPLLRSDAGLFYLVSLMETGGGFGLRVSG